MRISAALILILLMITISSPSISGRPSAVEGSISIDRTVQIVQNRMNETEVEVTGTFRVDSMDRPDQTFTTSADLDIDGELSTASLSQYHWDSVEEYRIYTYTVIVIIPADSPIGPYDTYTLTLEFTNMLGTSDTDPAKMTIELITRSNGGENSDDGPQGNNTADESSVGNPFPIWIIFVGGLVVLLVGGAVWFYRNVEIVREEDGGRRIMMKERKTYNKKDIEELSLDDDQL
jgi:hypothetical protein